jgi:hypothetical protein
MLDYAVMPPPPRAPRRAAARGPTRDIQQNSAAVEFSRTAAANFQEAGRDSLSFLQARGRIGSADNESDNRQQNSAVDWIILL